MLRQKQQGVPDKLDLEVNSRILLVMANVELNRVEEAIMQTNNFKKYVSRIGRSSINARTLSILNVLESLSKQSFDFSGCSSSVLSHIKNLTGGKEKYFLDKKSFELIPFQGWFFQKRGALKTANPFVNTANNVKSGFWEVNIQLHYDIDY